mmetsp:Transcript_111145/g.313612  ORF Transcript_111145/g.313612 Transcript_111145/m.313612 type:complete len:224 (+) Transcript_111145:816-1487(+)
MTLNALGAFGHLRIRMSGNGLGRPCGRTLAALCLLEFALAAAIEPQNVTPRLLQLLPLLLLLLLLRERSSKGSLLHVLPITLLPSWLRVPLLQHQRHCKAHQLRRGNVGSAPPPAYHVAPDEGLVCAHWRHSGGVWVPRVLVRDRHCGRGHGRRLAAALRKQAVFLGQPSVLDGQALHFLLQGLPHDRVRFRRHLARRIGHVRQFAGQGGGDNVVMKVAVALQ